MQVIRTLRKGLPRFVVFIMCDEDADGASAGGGMTDYGEEIKKERRKEHLQRGEGATGGGKTRKPSWTADPASPASPLSPTNHTPISCDSSYDFSLCPRHSMT